MKVAMAGQFSTCKLDSSISVPKKQKMINDDILIIVCYSTYMKVTTTWVPTSLFFFFLVSLAQLSLSFFFSLFGIEETWNHVGFSCCCFFL